MQKLRRYLTLGFVLAAPAAQAVNLITNGSFELPGTAGTTQLTAGNVPPGWIISDLTREGGHWVNRIAMEGTGFPTTGIVGNYFAETAYQTGDGTALNQTVSGLTAGESYVLRFKYGNPYTTQSLSYHAEVRVDTLTPTVWSASATNVTGDFRTASLSFVATSTAHTIKLKSSLLSNPLGCAFDDVSLEAVPCRGNWVAGRDLVSNERATATETTNPNITVPEWSYGYRSTLADSTLTLWTSAQHVNNQIGTTGVDGFLGGAPSLSVYTNTTASAIALPGYSSAMNPGDIWMHPGPGGQYSIVRWTAPAAGTFSISATYTDVNASSGDGANGSVVVNGSVLYTASWANGGPAVSTTIPHLTLAQGDVVDFAVGMGGNYNSDSTKLVATIQKLLPPAAAPAGFSLIPGGVFTMGDQSNPLVGDTDETAHTVNVSSFYMGQTEVTRTEWRNTEQWGLANGYPDLISAPSPGAAYPAHSLSWFDAVKWCNAKSEQEGLKPCYYDSTNTAVVRTGTPAGIICRFANDGYRLPTEAEWEKAARGGLTGQNFPLGNTISHAQANYWAGTSYAYDLSFPAGNHPSYPTTLSAPVNAFAPNGYGLYNMAGNVWEWCWDWYAAAYPASGGVNPTGNATGVERCIRGGSWNFDAKFARTASRDSKLATDPTNWIGLRLAKSVTPVACPSEPEIALLGNGLPLVNGDMTPATADHTDFGSTTTAGGTVCRTFTVCNIGSANLTLTMLPVSGTNAADFTVNMLPGSPVASAASTAFQVCFDPSQPGVRTAIVSFSNNDSDENPFSFTVQGNGIASADPCLTSLTLSAGAYSPALVPTIPAGYTLSVPFSQTSTTVTASPQYSGAAMQVRINGGAYNTLPASTPGTALPLNIGTNTVDVRVTAEDGTTIKVYSIVITRSEALPTVPCVVNLGLKNSGVNAAGAVQAAGWVDTAFAITSGPGTPPPYAVVFNRTGPGSSTASQWISDRSSLGSPGGEFRFVQTFSLSGFDPNSCAITGRYAADNSGKLFINGQQVPGADTVLSTGFLQWQSFTIPANANYFVSGLNTLEFRVQNDGSSLMGVRVEFTSVVAAPLNAQAAWQTYQTAVNAAVAPSSARTAILTYPTGDYDLDGVENYLEIALGTNATSGGSMPQLTNWLAPVAGSGSTQPRLHLSVQVPVSVGIPIHCRGSSDLVTWSPAVQVSSVPGNPGFNLLTWIAPASMPSNRSFLRVEAGACSP